MPYKTDQLKLDSPFLDKRCKLLPCQKEMMIWWWKEGLSQRAIAKMFGVSRRLVQFTCMPEKLQKNKESREDRGGSKQYYKGGEEWAEDMRNHRRRKYNILNQIKP